MVQLFVRTPRLLQLLLRGVPIVVLIVVVLGGLFHPAEHTRCPATSIPNICAYPPTAADGGCRLKNRLTGCSRVIASYIFFPELPMHAPVLKTDRPSGIACRPAAAIIGI